MNNIYYLITFIFVSILFFVSLYYIINTIFRKKREELEYIKNRICPNCKNILLEENIQSKNNCSSGTTTVVVTCTSCNYKQIFDLSNNSSCNI